MSPAPAEEVRVVLQGPGIDPEGKPYVLATSERAKSFADAVNFAYEQGLRDRMRRANGCVNEESSPRLVVSGLTPVALVIRKEHWWAWLKRRTRESRLRLG